MNDLDVRDLAVSGRRVLLRADLDTPLGVGARILDEWRLTVAIPTIQYLMRHDARIAILAHLGRPQGVRREDLSLGPIAERLGQILQTHVGLAPDCMGLEAKGAVDQLGPGAVVILENVRFHPGEEANDRHFARRLAELGDEYVNDAFGSSARAHASTTGIAQYFHNRAAGLRVVMEISRLRAFAGADRRPFVLVLGGNKIESKLRIISSFLDKIDVLLIGGLLATVFVEARELAGRSSARSEKVAKAIEILERAHLAGVEVHVPTDAIVRRTGSAEHETRIEPCQDVPPGRAVVDIGPETQANFCKEIAKAGRLAWNGPMGIYETEPFSHGTASIATAVSRLVAAGAATVVGGGDTAAAVRKLGLEPSMGHISVGGGALLVFLAGKPLPGIEALSRPA